MTILFIILLILLVDTLILLFGVDSRDGINSPEWQRRAYHWSRTLSHSN